jgi:hypothetical protein
MCFSMVDFYFLTWAFRRSIITTAVIFMTFISNIPNHPEDWNKIGMWIFGNCKEIEIEMKHNNEMNWNLLSYLCKGPGKVGVRGACRTARDPMPFIIVASSGGDHRAQKSFGGMCDLPSFADCHNQSWWADMMIIDGETELQNGKQGNNTTGQQSCIINWLRGLSKSTQSEAGKVSSSGEVLRFALDILDFKSRVIFLVGWTGGWVDVDKSQRDTRKFTNQLFVPIKLCIMCDIWPCRYSDSWHWSATLSSFHLLRHVALYAWKYNRNRLGSLRAVSWSSCIFSLCNCNQPIPSCRKT